MVGSISVVFWVFLAAPHSRLGIEPVPPAVEAQIPNHWTAREVPATFCLQDSELQG